MGQASNKKVPDKLVKSACGGQLSTLTLQPT